MLNDNLIPTFASSARNFPVEPSYYTNGYLGLPVLCLQLLGPLLLVQLAS